MEQPPAPLITNAHDPFSEPHWNQHRAAVKQSLDRIMNQIRTPGMRSEITRYINALSYRADSPAEFIPEAVEDARHDLMLLAGTVI